MEYSAGLILYRLRDDNEMEFFVCSPGGPYWVGKELWNFPKGHIEEGETSLEAALREFKEETNVDLKDANNIHFYGDIKQNKHKIVSVFYKEWMGEITNNCFSNTFIWEDGKEYPEIDKYDWKTINEIYACGGQEVYKKVYESIEFKAKNEDE